MKRLYDILSGRLTKIYEQLDDFFLKSDGDFYDDNVLFGIVTIIKNDGENFEFKVGMKHFLIRGEILLSTATIYLRTFHIVPDLYSYQASRMEHLINLDVVIIGNSNPYTRFVKKIDDPNSLMNDPTEIRNLKHDYAKQLWKTIEILEATDVPELDDISRRG